MHTKTNKTPLVLFPTPNLVTQGLGVGMAWAKRTLTRKRVLIGSGIAFGVVAVGMTASFFWPRTVSFAYSGDNCFTQPVVLPGLISRQESASYQAKPVASLSVAGYPLFARTTCITPTAAPQENGREAISFGAGFLTKDIYVAPGAFPSVEQTDMLEARIPTQEPLTLKLSANDETFDYRLLVNETPLACEKEGTKLLCDVTQLQLAQSTTYNVALERLWGGAPAGAVFTQPMTTVETISVVASSISPNQRLYEKPEGVSLTLNRPATSMEGAKLYLLSGADRLEVPIEYSVVENIITVRWAQPLARSSSFVLDIPTVRAADGGYLSPAYMLPFNTSGGPRVIGVSIGTSKVSPDASIVLTFDSPLLAEQGVHNFLKLEVGGQPFGGTVAVNNNVVTIKPGASLPRCAAFSVSVLEGLQSSYGVSGGTAWRYNSRTICQSVFSIGASVKGRSITAYRFGTGPSTVVFVGGTHGDENSSTYTLNSFIDYLETNAGSIPANRSVVVIPNINPDGYAQSRRTNANNVDLNRNFPANDWKQGVSMPDGSYNPNGGGSSPLSEPESSAVASYILGLNPRLVLTYHATAGIVIPNDAGDSVSLAKAYDQRSNLYFTANGGGTFDYDTTGSFEVWLQDHHGIPALLIELWTMGSSEIARNQTAMWFMVQLP